MTLKKSSGEGADSKSKKYVFRLREPAKRAQKALQDTLEKSLKRFQAQAEQSASEEGKSLFLKKSEKIANDLNILKGLSEDEVITYALSMLDKIMKVASNPRMPREERIKARIAAHKPLSTHLSRLKRTLNEPQETESESEIQRDCSSSTLNKVTFNNTVVLMRKDVRRAKVHIIHKLTRNIDMLRSKKGKEEQLVKAQRKAERLHKKVIHIKELHEDEISKFALSTSHNISQLATDVKAPTLSQALATVSLHRFVENHVKDFKTKYPDWQNIVPKLLKKKKKKRKMDSGTKDNRKDLSEVTHENAKSSNEEESESSENVEEEDVETPYGRTAQDVDDEEHASNTSDEMSSSSENEVDSLENTRKNPKKFKKSKDSIGKNKTTEIRKNKCGDINKERTNMPAYDKPRIVEDEPKVVDPFFVTTTNEEYVTSQVPVSSETNLPSGKIENFNSYEKRKFSSYDHNSKWERRGAEGKYGKLNRFQESDPYKKESLDKNSVNRKDKIIFGNRKERRKALQQPQAEQKVEKLHPSWEAKKKQSTIIPFQGKKVTFD